jgi:DNA-binding transcriptional MerR regulator
MGNLSGAELRRIERQFADGIKSATVVEIFRGKGHRFSEATLRKYVQLGLLPKSRRVGTRGRHRGSSGLYPVAIVRLVEEIKRALDEGATLEEVRYGLVGLAGEVEVLRRACDEVFGRFRQAAVRLDDRPVRSTLGRKVEAQRRALGQSLRELDRLAVRIGRRRA